MAAKSASGHVYRRMARFVFEQHGHRCHLCGHDGAMQLDHVESQTESPGRAHDAGNLRPVHGTTRGQVNPCATCSRAAGKPVNCNQIRGGYTIERAIRKLRELTGLPIPDYGQSSPARSGEREW